MPDHIQPQDQSILPQTGPAQYPLVQQDPWQLVKQPTETAAGLAGAAHADSPTLQSHSPCSSHSDFFPPLGASFKQESSSFQAVRELGSSCRSELGTKGRSQYHSMEEVAA